MIARFVLAALLCAGAPAFAADANRFAATIKPAESFDVGSTGVERHGQGGATLILIPGIAGGAWTWQETVRQFANDYTVYVLTLPGFDGRPAVAGKGLAAAEDSLRELIETRKLVRPVLIGHSLGGTMAMDYAARHPDAVRGVVSIDGLPLLPGTEDWNPAQRTPVATSTAARMIAGTPQMFAMQQQMYMRGMGVVDMARADELAKLMARSDPAAVSRYMGEALALDLRPALPAIKAPVLVISPYFQLDAEQLKMTEAAKTAYYQALMNGTQNVRVVSVSPARHFAMFDQPEKVTAAIREYLKGLPE